MLFDATSNILLSNGWLRGMKGDYKALEMLE